MVVVLAVVLTAVVVAVATAPIVRRATRESINQAIGGRSGADPIDEHRRLLQHEREAAAQAAARCDLFNLALDALTSGVIVTDHAGKVLVRNRLSNDVSTRSHEQTLVDAAAAELLSGAIQGRRVEREIDVFGPPARILFIHAAPITSAAQVVGALAVIDDVTDHHRIDKTRRDFIANLSHELRTPVGAISLLTEMLVDEHDTATRSQLTDRLLIETERMSATIEDLLELSRIESDTDVFDDLVVVQPLLDEAVARVVVAAEARSVELGIVAPAEAIQVKGNRDQLLSALVNLIENAVKYSDAGDSVSVRTRVDDQVLSLVVQDTGRGIPGRDLDRIFERFYRVDRSRDQATGGTGIGLSIVRHVALNHGGTVDVESFEGDGSTFTLALPIVANQRIDPSSTSAR